MLKILLKISLNKKIKSKTTKIKINKERFIINIRFIIKKIIEEWHISNSISFTLFFLYDYPHQKKSNKVYPCLLM